MAVIEGKAYMNIYVCLHVHTSKIKRNGKTFSRIEGKLA